LRRLKPPNLSTTITLCTWTHILTCFRRITTRMQCATRFIYGFPIHKARGALPVNATHVACKIFCCFNVATFFTRSARVSFECAWLTFTQFSALTRVGTAAKLLIVTTPTCIPSFSRLIAYVCLSGSDASIARSGWVHQFAFQVFAGAVYAKSRNAKITRLIWCIAIPIWELIDDLAFLINTIRAES